MQGVVFNCSTGDVNLQILSKLHSERQKNLICEALRQRNEKVQMYILGTIFPPMTNVSNRSEKGVFKPRHFIAELAEHHG